MPNALTFSFTIGMELLSSTFKNKKALKFAMNLVHRKNIPFHRFYWIYSKRLEFWHGYTSQWQLLKLRKTLINFWKWNQMIQTSIESSIEQIAYGCSSAKWWTMLKPAQIQSFLKYQMHSRVWRLMTCRLVVIHSSRQLPTWHLKMLLQSEATHADTLAYDRCEYRHIESAIKRVNFYFKENV